MVSSIEDDWSAHFNYARTIITPPKPFQLKQIPHYVLVLSLESTVPNTSELLMDSEYTMETVRKVYSFKIQESTFINLKIDRSKCDSYVRLERKIKVGLRMMQSIESMTEYAR
jgi:hypothetical protein